MQNLFNNVSYSKKGDAKTLGSVHSSRTPASLGIHTFNFLCCQITPPNGCTSWQVVSEVRRFLYSLK